MVKKIFVGVIVLMLGVLIYFSWLFYDFFQPVETIVPIAESHIQVTVYRMEAENVYEISNHEERELLLRIFGKSYLAVLDTPSCPFSYFKISFTHQGRSIDFFPAADDCNLVRYGNAPGLGGKIFEIDTIDSNALTRFLRGL